MSGQRSSDKEAAEFRLLYQVTTDDIKHVRRQQWATTCYALLLIAGILGFHDLLFHPSPIERIISVLLAFVVAIAGTLYLITLQKTLSTYRSKLMTITDHFSEVSREALLETQSHYSRFQYHFYTMVLPFILVMFLAASFVAWFAYR
jgi:membrane protein YdbS with pleckstrin-like domain